MARRTPNEGTVFQSKNGRWVAMIELPRQGDGKRRRRMRRARTKSEAIALLREMQEELRRSGTVARRDRTVADAIETFRSSRPPSHHDDWLFSLITSGLGARKLSALSVAECDAFLVDCAAGKYGRRPIGQDHLRRVRQRLAGVLRNEMRLGTISRNVAEVAHLPNTDVEARDRRSLTVDELRQLLDAATGPILVLTDLCGRNGLRPAEARALRSADVDLDRREIEISGQMNRHNKRGPVKRATNAARTIQIDERTAKRLEAWSTQRQALCEAAGPAWQETGYLAVTTLGTPIGRELFANSLRALCLEVPITPPVTPYELRHTAISHQADAGHTSWEIADWAGTSESMISSRYRHRLRRTARLRPAGS